MNIFLLLTLSMLLIVIMLRKKFPLGISMLAGGLLVWFLKAPHLETLMSALTTTLTQTRTYDLIAALYLVMCLEIELRTSNTLARLVAALKGYFKSAKVLLVVMPAFLGLLPSLGGARFSAPIVEEASKGFDISEDDKSAINFWFRHPFEFSNPIIPGMIMACSITGVAYSDFVKSTAWLSLLCILVGWIILIRPIKSSKTLTSSNEEGSFIDIILSLSPIILTFFLVVFFQLSASIAMALTTFTLFFVLKIMGREVSLKEVIIGAIDCKMFLNVLCIFFFVNLLTDTKALAEVVAAFQVAPLPIPVIIALISLVVGILTGISQAHVAIVMPLVAAMHTGDLTLATTAMAFGVAGQMLTPTHMCLVVTLDYFKADIFRMLKPILLIETIVLSIYSAYVYFFI